MLVAFVKVQFASGKLPFAVTREITRVPEDDTVNFHINATGTQLLFPCVFVTHTTPLVRE